MTVGFTSLSQWQLHAVKTLFLTFLHQKDKDVSSVREETSSVFGRQKYCAYWLSSRGPHAQRRVLYQLVEAVTKRPGKLTKRVSFHRDNAAAHKSSFQWLLCVILALNWFITLPILLILTHLTMICYSTWKKHLAGNQYAVKMRAYFLKMRVSSSIGSKHYNID